MPYAKRDEDGNIVALYRAETEQATEKVSGHDADVMQFVLGDEPEANASALYESDLQAVRIIEDLIELLVAKHVILITELPQAARRKLLDRRQARGRLCNQNLLIVEQKDLL